MATIYNLEDMKLKLELRKREATAFLEKWEAVTFPTKKDGTPFKVMSKNIAGARYTLEQYAMQPGEYELTICTGHIEGLGYRTDTVKAHNLVKYCPDEQKAKTENYQPKTSYLEQVYTYDLEDIKKAVADRISYLEGYIADLTAQIEESEQIYKTFRELYANAFKSLEDATAKFSHKDLYYMAQELIKNRFPYC